MDELKMTVTDGMVVTLDFTLTLTDGEVADSTQGEMPLRFVVGQGQLLPGLEDAMIGMGVNEERDITLRPEDAYGEWDEDALEEIALDELPEGVELEEDAPEVTDTEGETGGQRHEVRGDGRLTTIPARCETLTSGDDVLPRRELEHTHHGMTDTSIRGIGAVRPYVRPILWPQLGKTSRFEHLRLWLGFRPTAYQLPQTSVSTSLSLLTYKQPLPSCTCPAVP
jgi:hypothetical protein